MTHATVRLLLTVLTLIHGCSAFTHPAVKHSLSKPTAVPTRGATFIGAKKKNDDYDFSDIETRDMTKEEMLAVNAQNEKTMNMELTVMTGFSVLISVPILYLCWVAFYSD